MFCITTTDKISQIGTLRKLQKQKWQPVRFPNSALWWVCYQQDLVAPGTATGVATGPLPVPQNPQLLRCVLGRRQHVQVTLLLTQPARILPTKGKTLIIFTISQSLAEVVVRLSRLNVHLTQCNVSALPWINEFAKYSCQPVGLQHKLQWSVSKKKKKTWKRCSH